MLGCGGDDDSGNTDDGPRGVTDLVLAGSEDDVTVIGNLFAEPARPGSPSSMLLCDWVGEADVPDVPPLECKGERLEVRSDLDLYLLDLGWQSADGRAQYSERVELTADFDGDDLVATAVARDGEMIRATRPDAADRTVPPGESDLCGRMIGADFGPPPANSTVETPEGVELPAVVWSFGATTVDEISGDMVHEGRWSCIANEVRAFGTGGLEGLLSEVGGRLVLTTPDGTEYVQYGELP